MTSGGGQCTKDNEAEHTERVNHAVVAANDGHVDFPSANGAKALSNRLRCSGACREAGAARPLRAHTARACREQRHAKHRLVATLAHPDTRHGDSRTS